jgi:arabinogalactan oligomer/maltooligosaccharide transport system permease protein
MTRALVALALVLASALPAHAEPLRLWHAYGGAEEEGLREAVRAFERRTGHEVDLLAVAFGAYLAKLQSAIPTGRGPDVFIDAHERLTSYVDDGLVRPFASEVPDTLPEESLGPLRQGDTLYGLPLSMKCAALYLNTELMPEAPESLDGLARAQLPEGTFPLVMEAENGYYVAAILHSLGGQLLTDEGEYGFTGDAAERATRWLAARVSDRTIPDEATGELVQRLFASGDAAAAVSGPWLAPDLPDDLRWTVVPLPPLEDGGPPLEPFLTVEAAFAASQPEGEERGNAEAADALIRFLAGTPGSRIRGTVGQQVVADEGAWADSRLAHNEFLATFRRAARRARPMPTDPRMRMTFVPAQRALRRVLRGGAPPSEALATGARDFADDTRPPPEARDPLPLMIALGLLMLALAGWWIHRARDPAVRLAIRESLPAYKWVAHAFVAVSALVILPLLVGAAVSLFAGRGRDLHYVGLANYADILTARGGELLGDRSFYMVLLVTVLWTVLNLLLHLGIGVALALLLNRPTLRFKGPYRVLLILPWAVPSYVTALAWKGMFHRQLGAINAILESLGADPVSWFAHFGTAFAANLATNVWLGFPFMMVVTLGALSSIPSDLYEAAAVDGATRWQRFRRITAPLLVPSLAPAVVMGAVWTFNMFNVVFLVSGGEPGGATEILVSEAYRWAFTRGQLYGYAAAYAVLIFLILALWTRATVWVGTRSRRRAPVGATT